MSTLTSTIIIIIMIGFLINVQAQGQHPHQWTPFQVAGLLHTWQISHQISRLSIMRVNSRELPLSVFSLSAASMSSWASQAHTFHQKAVLTAPLEHSTCLYQQGLLFFRMRSRSSMPSHASSSLELVVTVSWGLTLQTCLIIGRWRFGFVNGQVSLAWSIAFRTQVAHTATCLVGKKELITAP